jgi:hypothetical protein
MVSFIAACPQVFSSGGRQINPKNEREKYLQPTSFNPLPINIGFCFLKILSLDYYFWYAISVCHHKSVFQLYRGGLLKGYKKGNEFIIWKLLLLTFLTFSKGIIPRR